MGSGGGGIQEKEIKNKLIIHSKGNNIKVT